MVLWTTPQSPRAEEVTVPGMQTTPTYDHYTQRVCDIEVGRLLTLTGEGNAQVFRTGDRIRKPLSIRIIEVTKLPGARAAIVKGMPVTGNGEQRKNGTMRHLLVAEGSFLVCW